MVFWKKVNNSSVCLSVQQFLMSVGFQVSKHLIETLPIINAIISELSVFLLKIDWQNWY